MNERPHGLARYKKGPDRHGNPGTGCRCPVCEQANRDYDSRRARQVAYKRWEPYIPAGRAREHVRWLMSRGMGWQRVAREAGVAAAPVSRLLYGSRGSAPTRRIRPRTEAALLAVRPPAVRGFGGPRVDSAGTIRRIQALALNGWPLAWLSARLGQADIGKVLGHPTVTPATEMAVRELCSELWLTPPPAVTPSGKRAVTRIRARARREGWAALAAWDDEPGPHCIDDPAASPAPGWYRRDTRRYGVLTEEAAELDAQGEHPEMIAARLGASVKSVERTLTRIREAA